MTVSAVFRYFHKDCGYDFSFIDRLCHYSLQSKSKKDEAVNSGNFKKRGLSDKIYG